MSEPVAAVRGIVFTHGRMAEGMVDAVRTIAGTPEEALVPLSNEGRGPESLMDELDRLAGDAPAVIFTDLQSGSCAMAARLSCRGRAPRAVVCGANLPMLLDFVFNREMPLDALVVRLVESGRKGIQALPAPSEAP
ncbi:MAG: hypothetical protein KY453_01075 [Gemmatimonadetes bacterium]|nr:hypothetical protein [Gemmatimonadota bacterium]